MSDIIHELEINDFIMVVVDGCIKKISKDEFLNGLIYPGNSTCELLHLCIDNIGEYTPINPSFAQPKITDIEFFLNNGVHNYSFGGDIPNHFTKNDGEELGYIQIIGGDIYGIKLNGINIFIGQKINKSDFDKLKIDTKNQTQAYQQVVFFNAFDINHVKAI